MIVIGPGTKIKVAVPIDPSDNRPFVTRKDFRRSVVTSVDGDIVTESEGRVLFSRGSVDWVVDDDPVEKADEGRACVVNLASGPVLGSFARVTGQNAEIYTDSYSPPGATAPGALMIVPVRECGRSWDWLRGRSPQEAHAGLSVVFDPLADKPAADGRKRPGRKPKVKATEATTAAPPNGSDPIDRGGSSQNNQTVSGWTKNMLSEGNTHEGSGPEQKTVSASDVDGRASAPIVVSFRARMLLWDRARDLVSMLESEARHLEVIAAVEEMARVLKDGAK